MRGIRLREVDAGPAVTVTRGCAIIEDAGMSVWAPRTRLLHYYALNAAGSTLRLTLGCLLAQQLGIERRRVGSGKRMTFGAGERILSDWMSENAFVRWLEHPAPREMERQLILELRPPLNLAENSSHSFYTELSRLRRKPERLRPASATIEK